MFIYLLVKGYLGSFIVSYLVLGCNGFVLKFVLLIGFVLNVYVRLFG